MSVPDLIKKRLAKDRPMTTVTLRIPVDVVDSLKEIAPQRGFSGYQPLLKWYVSEGLRRDEAQYTFGHTARLITSLKQHGVPEALLEEALRETASGGAAPSACIRSAPTPPSGQLRQCALENEG